MVIKKNKIVEMYDMLYPQEAKKWCEQNCRSFDGMYDVNLENWSETGDKGDARIFWNDYRYDFYFNDPQDLTAFLIRWGDDDHEYN